MRGKVMQSTDQEQIMKQIQTVVQRLAVCGLALAMAGSLWAQSPPPGAAKVVRLKGGARYTTGNNVWQPLRVGSVVRPGTVIQTAGDGSYVDLVLGDGQAPLPRPMARPVIGDSRSYTPSADQNIVRLFENTVLGVDKLSSTETGADIVSETQLDLQRGRLFGNVKKMSAASKYEVKLPNGVAGIRGTIYTLSADGVVQVLVGSVVIAYIGADGNAVTQVVMGGQQFDAKTGQITPIADFNQKEMVKLAKESRIGPNVPATTFTVDHTIYYVSPTTGFNGNAGANGP
jgi:FecR-like protein